MVRQGLLVLAFAISTSANANSTQDVIYKKDGSILKGTLIEQNFQTGQYKIQLSGGSVFVVQKDDIEKITKEAAPVNNTELELEAVASESRAKLQPQSSLVVTSQQPTPQYSVPVTNFQTHYVTYFGILAHTITSPYSRNFFGEALDKKERYSGGKLGFQINHSKHIATHYGFEFGKLKEIEIVNKKRIKAGKFRTAESTKPAGKIFIMICL